MKNAIQMVIIQEGGKKKSILWLWIGWRSTFEVLICKLRIQISYLMSQDASLHDNIETWMPYEYLNTMKYRYTPSEIQEKGNVWIEQDWYTVFWQLIELKIHFLWYVSKEMSICWRNEHDCEKRTIPQWYVISQTTVSAHNKFKMWE